MIQAFVVVESNLDADILKYLLPARLVNQTKFVPAMGRNATHSMSRTLLAVDQLPLALVIDADTDSSAAIERERDSLRELLTQVAPDEGFEIFFAIPEIEAVFFQDRPLLERLINRRFVDEQVWQQAKHSPKAFLSSLQPDYPTLIHDILDALDQSDVQVLQQHPLIADVSQFLASAIEEKVVSG